MFSKEALSTLSIILTFVGFYPYLRSIAGKQTKPHVFSWVIWGITTLIVCFAQLTDGGGVGAWPTGISALITFYVAYLAYRNIGDTTISRTDWICFITALCSVPLWFLTEDPLASVVLLTLMDIVASVPTFRKSLMNPYSENIPFYVIIGIRSFLQIFALEHYSWTTVLFPAAIGVMCLLMVVVLIAGRLRDDG